MVQKIWRKAGQIYQIPGWGRVVTGLKWLLGIGLLVLSFQGVDFTFLGQQIKGIDTTWLFLAIGSILVSLMLKMLRWGYFIYNYRLPYAPLRIGQAFLMGQAANILLPVRGGEVVRISWLLPSGPRAAAEIAATILLEKYLDLLALTLCIFQVLIYLPAEQAARAKNLLGPLSVLATLLLTLVVLIGPEVWRWLRSHTSHLSGARLERVLQQMDRLVETSRWLRQPSRLALSVGLTALIWVSMLSTNLLLFRALHISQGLEAGGLVLVLVYMGLFPAIMPGNMGPFYFFAQLALQPFAVPESQSLAFAILLHLITTLPPLAFGALFLFGSEERPKMSIKSALSLWKRT